MRHTVVRSVAALLGFVTVGACPAGGTQGDRPQVLVLRSAPDPHHDALLRPADQVR